MRSAATIFSSRLFWDVDFESLDLDKKSDFVIQRVFERGDIPDIRNCRKYYGDEKISNALLNAKYLDLPTVYLASAIIDRPVTDFRCYKPKRSNPGHWSY